MQLANLLDISGSTPKGSPLGLSVIGCNASHRRFAVHLMQASGQSCKPPSSKLCSTEPEGSTCMSTTPVQRILTGTEYVTGQPAALHALYESKASLSFACCTARECATSSGPSGLVAYLFRSFFKPRNSFLRSRLGCSLLTLDLRKEFLHRCLSDSIDALQHCRLHIQHLLTNW